MAASPPTLRDFLFASFSGVELAQAYGDVSFDLISVHDPGGVDYGLVFDGLKSIGYDGTVTVHQSAQPGETPEESASHTADYLRTLI